MLAGCEHGFKLPVWLEPAQPSAPAEAVPEEAPQGAQPEAAGPQAEMETAALPPTAALPAAPTVPGPPGIVRIGLLLPLSGRGQAEGQALLDAAALALFDLGGQDLELLPRDTGGTPEGALRAAGEVLNGGAQVLLGPLFADEVSAVAPAARVRGVAVVAFSTNAKVAGEGVYILGFTPQQQVERIAAYAIEHGYRRIAVLAPDNAYGQTVVETLRAALPRLGGEFAAFGLYAPDASDAPDVVRRLADYDRRHAALLREKAALADKDDEVSKQALARLETLDTLGDPPFDALLFADGGERLYRVAPLLDYYDIDPAKVRLLGTGLWDDPASLAEPTLAGGWFAGAAPAAREGFERRFAAAYGERPPRLATLAYDGMLLVGALARLAPGPDFSVRVLGLPSGFVGVDGAFRFRSDGVAERSLAVLEVEKGARLAVLSPAPGDFRVSGE